MLCSIRKLQIVDLALLVKKGQETSNPVKAAMPPSINPESTLVKIFNITGHKTATSSASATPVHTPPPDATAATHSNPNSSTTTAASTSSGTSLIAPVQGGLASSLGTASLASSGLIKPSKAKKKKTKVFLEIFLHEKLDT